MDEEYNSLLNNNTWSLKNLPSDRKVLPSKSVYKTKTDQCGNIVRFKARLVIKGYAQKKGTGYEKVFSTVEKYSTIRHLISLGARLGLETDQLDAVSAFLQRDIDVEIYMTQPELYEQGPQNRLMQYLEMKDLGKATQCVGLNVTRDGDSIIIDQEKYIKDVLDRFGMSDCKPCKTPVEVGQKFPQGADGKETD
ncbi:Retrovirus-related Pol polyprotein from transposon TNT 1-94 [Eumeta japonica]|uniref:Retrovirus-related Pol polyprotein from transposon TNT 1-94 n=1 Tax=Eumeta variegata TaxID=151549 RepID=A0A4C1SQ99_EUMVA|nr:Retrovirus-related Pol polyprotein from transposon TNT 1-94 [Eumeta japonica]